MNYAHLIHEIEIEVTQLLERTGQNALTYHNLDHSKFVVSKAAEIARHYVLNDKDFFIVMAAAWFHDSGYIKGTPHDHEQRSASIAELFLQTKGLDQETINQIKGCILSTQIPQNPNNQLEQIVCDSDLFHLGTESFRGLNKKMKKEAESISGKEISKEFWNRETLQLLELHRYQTDYAKNLLTIKKQEHIDSIKSKLKENYTEESILTHPVLTQVEHNNDTDKTKTKRPDRGIETMFRISSNNHQSLSDMADNKANIMITTTSIILSILLSVLLRKLEDNHHLVIPAILLIAVCVTTMVFSILATRPALPGGKFTQQEMDEKKTNLLFFGNFYRMRFEEYSIGMDVMMNDRDFLYGSLTRDVFSQGIVLGRKYHLLRIAYNVFMYGIISSVLAFIIALISSIYQ